LKVDNIVSTFLSSGQDKFLQGLCTLIYFRVSSQFRVYFYNILD